MLNFFETVFRQIGQTRVVRWKFWLDKNGHSNVKCTFEVFGARFHLDFKYDGETVQIISGGIVLDKVIREMWNRIMDDIKENKKQESVDKRPYICVLCGHGFVELADLAAHYYIHVSDEAREEVIASPSSRVNEYMDQSVTSAVMEANKAVPPHIASLSNWPVDSTYERLVKGEEG